MVTFLSGTAAKSPIKSAPVSPVRTPVISKLHLKSTQNIKQEDGKKHKTWEYFCIWYFTMLPMYFIILLPLQLSYKCQIIENVLLVQDKQEAFFICWNHQLHRPELSFSLGPSFNSKLVALLFALIGIDVPFHVNL